MLATAPCATGQPLFGFNEDWSAAGHEVKASSAFRPTVGRLHLNWSLIESKPGTYDWSGSDPIYHELVAHGAPPIALVFAPPCWAAANVACPATRVYPIDRHRYDDWERFIRAVVGRYPKLVALEVWNEPNYGAYHYPLPDLEGYVETLEHAHRASKAIRPQLPVLGGSLAPITTARRSARDGGFPRHPPAKLPYAPFLDRMYALGAARYMDGLAFHPYPNFAPYLRRPARLSRGIRPGFERGVRLDLQKQIATVSRIARRHRARRPIWATETGVCTSGPRERQASPREQALAVKQIYVTLERLRVKAILTHRLWDVRVPGTPADNIENGCGLTDLNGRRKPAWHTLHRIRAARATRRGRHAR